MLGPCYHASNGSGNSCQKGEFPALSSSLPDLSAYTGASFEGALKRYISRKGCLL
jgi:hypothetical protein